MEPHTTLVIGASRGIGKELVRQLSSIPSEHVIATIRDSSSPTTNLQDVQYLTLDLQNPQSILNAATKVPSIDTLIINGAIGDNERLVSTNTQRMEEYMSTNVLGPLRVVQAFLPALKARKTRKIILISSYCGSFSIQNAGLCGWGGPYAVSKAAANMLAVQLHRELRPEGFTVVPLHPGNVATDMGNIGGGGGTPVCEAVGNILRTIGGITLEESGGFLSYDGEVIPW
ncbi:NAD(P)-binding protein [Aspergillus sclerotiicarbonarius CBS 121057]|uniref:NAD(P)-binding protein n=1 Tax=Aspergillus sclerotiicarbonarius (strain CBS 121057 / IBT 28362) TaxID=1448318 RepID=A0A319EIL9_ASPSB|nr:NAD(P)-binding protein [Aspergillus sclerotiicarbonarius CBS 121057]